MEVDVGRWLGAAASKKEVIRPFHDEAILKDARQHYYTSHSVLGPYSIIPMQTPLYASLLQEGEALVKADNWPGVLQMEL